MPSPERAGKKRQSALTASSEAGPAKKQNDPALISWYEEANSGVLQATTALAAHTCWQRRRHAAQAALFAQWCDALHAWDAKRSIWLVADQFLLERQRKALRLELQRLHERTTSHRARANELRREWQRVLASKLEASLRRALRLWGARIQALVPLMPSSDLIIALLKPRPSLQLTPLACCPRPHPIPARLSSLRCVSYSASPQQPSVGSADFSAAACARRATERRGWRDARLAAAAWTGVWALGCGWEAAAATCARMAGHVAGRSAQQPISQSANQQRQSSANQPIFSAAPPLPLRDRHLYRRWVGRSRARRGASSRTGFGLRCEPHKRR